MDNKAPRNKRANNDGDRIQKPKRKGKLVNKLQAI
jgi:hypothetical protein